ncbi:hypothetical protein Poli38472_004683 [Pythium oligandrum]|uniref:BZIP domain-containing protein n=1 Tax=Pythium oligandrum TaxID=41045 RepID=A0A8K1CAS0_PYTOL|nr:hypothetical protein Poli38472_004683 [Pythium oligandrum]|eukprot:TMW59614.1 hypothetical protein Poli38472_004683 [Pythium oligandrum]
MTDFIRSIFQNANNAAAPTADCAEIKAELLPVNQIQIPPSTTAPSTIASTTGLSVEKQRLIKVEILEPSMNTPATVDASKAQRAARRDVVNARRDKRKAMAAASSPTAALAAPQTVSMDSSDEEVEDKSKKMKTGKTSSVAVVGGLAASTASPTAESTNTVKKMSSSAYPPTPGLLFTPEIDAAGEERIRAMEAQLETLDPDSKEAKKKRRLIRNRMSAQLHRERKKAYVGQLEDQLLEKDRELKLLQEKMAKMMDESAKLKQQLTDAEKQAQTQLAAPQCPLLATPKPLERRPSGPVTSPIAKLPATAVVKTDDDVVIKEEPHSWDSSWPLGGPETWDLNGLVDDAEMSDIETEDLLRDFDYPFAGLDEYSDFTKPHPEIHAAKKNLAMMMAVMFSVSFFGNSPSFYNVANGSNFSSMFDANPPKDFSQMSIASRIVACLEKTSWKDFRDVTSWISAQARAKEASEENDDAENAPAQSVASPSAASDITDTSGSCGSPSQLDDCLDAGSDLIDEFMYPVDDSFAAVADASSDWLMNAVADDKTKSAALLESEKMFSKKSNAQPKSSSMSSRLYEKLTTLWREKNQVLLTVLNSEREVTKRAIADMSTIREGLQSGDFFTKVCGSDAAGTTVSEDQSVTFLYPMSAFGTEKPVEMPSGSDPMFLEVSCQMNGGAVAMKM